MKKLLKPAWITLCVFLLILFIISCFSSYVSPASFSYMSLFAIMFPYLFVAVLVCACINFYVEKKLALLMLVCLLPGLINLSKTIAFNLPQKSDNIKNDSALRVLTWNVEDFVSLDEKSPVRLKMLDVITQNNPDVLCLQEYTNAEGFKKRVSVRKELDSLGYVYYFFSSDEVHIRKHGQVIRGTAIFSKQPLIDSGRVNIRKDWLNENLIYTNINFNGKPLRIFTAHLASFELYKDTDDVNKDVYTITYDRKRAIQYKLREIEQLHQKEVAIIKSEMAKTNLPVIYCGDMNTLPTSYTYRFLKNNLQDAFLEKGLGIGATFYKILPMLRIDYCFADKRFKILNCIVINKKLSDHYPVVTTMQWK